MIQQILAYLGMDTDPAVAELISVVNASLNTAAPAPACPPAGFCPDDAGRLLHILAQKKARLLELYLEQAIEKSEYLQKAEEFEQERERLEYRLQSGHRRSRLQEDESARIPSFIQSLIAGGEQDDPFYRNLIEQIVVRDPGHIEIVLKNLAVRWSFRREDASPAGA